MVSQDTAILAIQDLVDEGFLTGTPISKTDEIAQWLRDRIGDGTYRPGDQLPVSRALAAAHGVSRGTVDIARRRLVSERLLETGRRRGTYVLPPPPPTP
ncbi:winged helix-turn-helix domain-containing protein [Streptomyces sp. NPDC006703]|uniref:winged helix-turn-helix domain-containing protein n=1 Tax=Streptomyces sp. NPDC006703 TaxID=3364759 RepID=UPI0036C1ED27